MELNPQFSDNNDDDGNNTGGDDYYFPSPGEDPARVLLIQMITAISLMFSLFFCIGCFMVCCCGHPGITMDGNGFVFGRPDEGGGEMRLLTEDEVLTLPEVEFVVRRDSDDDDDDNDDLEVGPRKSIDGNDTSTATLLIQSNMEITNTDDHTTSSSPVARRQQPLQHQPSTSLPHDSLSFNAMCSICLEEYEEGEMLRMLPCHHMFHTECIVPWLTERFPNCPLCKAHVTAEQRQDGGNGSSNEDGEGVGVALERHDGDDGNSVNEEEVMEGGGVIERSGEQSSNSSIRSFFEMMSVRASADYQQQHANNVDGGGGEESLSSGDQIRSNLRTPLLQDSSSSASS